MKNSIVMWSSLRKMTMYPSLASEVEGDVEQCAIRSAKNFSSLVESSMYKGGL